MTNVDKVIWYDDRQSRRFSTDEFNRLCKILDNAFAIRGMDAKEVAMDLIIAGYGEVDMLTAICEKLKKDNQALESKLDMYILKLYVLQREMEELKNANSKRSKSNDAR